jgi:hypothetical protein
VLVDREADELEQLLDPVAKLKGRHDYSEPELQTASVAAEPTEAEVFVQREIAKRLGLMHENARADNPGAPDLSIRDGHSHCKYRSKI